MRVRAVAAASERSNAVGSVELECTPHGLVIVYLGLGSFSEGYTPGALTSGTRVTVPWDQVRHAAFEGDQLFLAIDEQLTPHNRLTLVHFSSGDAEPASELRRQRRILRLFFLALAILGTMLASVTFPRVAPEAGALAATVLGLTAALVILAIGFIADRRVALGGASSEVAREGLSLELSMYLPTLIRSPQAPAPKPKPPKLPSLQGLLPRTTIAVVLTLTAGGLGAVLTARWIVAQEKQAVIERNVAAADYREPPRLIETSTRTLADEPPPEPAAQAAPPPAPRPGPQPTRAPQGAAQSLSVSGACGCARAESPLWDEPIPRLSILILSSRLRKTGKRGDRNELVLDIAVVNNADQELNELELMVHFYEVEATKGNDKGKPVRHHESNRALYYEGPLLPGKAIKWTVAAEGSSYEIENPIVGDIGPGGDGAAPIDRFAELLDANHRPVRLHGAMMLTYLGDARAKEAVLTLRDALREDEAPYLRRLLEALSDVRVCQLTLESSPASATFQACIYNGTKEPKDKVGLMLRALDAPVLSSQPVANPPLILKEATFAVPGTVAAESGVRVTGFFDVSDAGQPTKAFEALADRIDLLH